MGSNRISVRVNPKLRRRLEREAAANRKRPSDVVRDALEIYLDQRIQPESCYDLALRTGFVGAAKNATPDLSTNAKHFEGFGRR